MDRSGPARDALDQRPLSFGFYALVAEKGPTPATIAMDRRQNRSRNLLCKRRILPVSPHKPLMRERNPWVIYYFASGRIGPIRLILEKA